MNFLCDWVLAVEISSNHALRERELVKQFSARGADGMCSRTRWIASTERYESHLLISSTERHKGYWGLGLFGHRNLVNEFHC